MAEAVPAKTLTFTYQSQVDCGWFDELGVHALPPQWLFAFQGRARRGQNCHPCRTRSVDTTQECLLRETHTSGLVLCWLWSWYDSKSLHAGTPAQSRSCSRAIRHDPSGVQDIRKCAHLWQRPAARQCLPDWADVPPVRKPLPE